MAVLAPVNIDVETYPLSAESMFCVLGLARLQKGAAIMATDRDDALRSLKTHRRDARELVALESPVRFLPAAPSLEDVRDAIVAPIDVDGWRYVDVAALAEVAKRAVEYLGALAPPFLTDGLMPEDYWPSPLDHGPLTRAYALLARPWTIWPLLKCGALLPDEVACLTDVLPETLQVLSSVVLEAVVNARAAKQSWLPNQLTTAAVQVLHVVEQSQDQRIADMFGQAAQAQEAAQPSPGKPVGNDATPTQKREAQEGGSNA